MHYGVRSMSADLTADPGPELPSHAALLQSHPLTTNRTTRPGAAIERPRRKIHALAAANDSRAAHMRHDRRRSGRGVNPCGETMFNDTHAIEVEFAGRG